MRYFIYFTLFIPLFFTVEISHAESVKKESVKKESASKKAYVKNTSQLIARSPSGRKMGELYINSPVEVLEEKNGWSKVSVKTWIRTNALAEKTKKKTKKGVSSGEIKVSSYTTKIVSDGLPTKRMYVNLKLKNTTKKDITGWSALLVAQSEGSVLFREPIADDTKIIKANSIIDISFYWEDGEKPFNALFGTKPSDVDLQLYKLKLN